MANRKVILNRVNWSQIFHLNYMYNDKVRNESGTRPKVDAESMLYASMIQAGINGFITVNPHYDLYKSNFFAGRIDSIHDTEWEVAYQLVTDSFNTFFSEETLNTKNPHKHLYYIEMFIADLLVALKRKCSAITLFPIMEIERERNYMTPELFMVLKNLMDSVQSHNPTLPIPQSILATENIQRFQDVITSDLFDRYSCNHEKLETNLLPTLQAYADIERSGVHLLNENKNLLRLKKSLISVIPLTTKIIDLVFGKLPGILSEFFGEKLAKLLKDDRRIVIYHFDTMFRDLWMSSPNIHSDLKMR